MRGVRRGERTALARIIDANANRAAEGLRVADDLARFALDDADLTGLFRELRHQIRAAVASLPVDPGMLMASRDTPGDVGAEAPAMPATLPRESLRAIALSACGRAAEAMRSIEEGAKGLGAPEAAARVATLRYRLYDAQFRLVRGLGTGRGTQWRVCVLITGSLCTHHPWTRVAEAAVAGGARCLQLREKGLGDAELLRRARALVSIARAGGASCIINDRPDIAMLSGADGVHVGQSDLSVDDIRRIAGHSLLIGVSTANMDQARAAAAAGADYVGLGPMFESGTKPKAALAGVEYLKQFLADPRSRHVPHLAISGVTPGNIGELAAVGCKGVAVSGVVCGAEKPGEVCTSLLAALQ